MSVRLGILTVLTLGRAYGLQIHGELESRMNRVGEINVGQIYSTLDRLQTQGLVTLAGATADGLPLYTVTESGHAEAEEWLSFDTVGRADWDEMVGHVLMATSVPGRSALPVVDGYRERSEELRAFAQRSSEHASAQRRLGALGDSALADAAIRWLDDVAATLAGPADTRQGLGEVRPRRGRRPA